MEIFKPKSISEKDTKSEITFPKVSVETYTEITPRIEGTFNPVEEIIKLRTVPKDQRPEAVKEFRSKLASQREGLGYCRIEAQKRIENNPNISREELIDIFNQFSEVYGFTEDQKKLAERIVDRFLQNRENIKRFSSETTGTKRTIQRLFDCDIKKSEENEFQISTNPYSIRISTSKKNVNRLYNRGMDAEDENVLGFAQVPSYINSKSNPSVIVVCTESEYQDASVEEHEVQHVQNGIIENALVTGSGSVSRLMSNIAEKRTLKEKFEHKLVLGFFKFKKIADYPIWSTYLTMKEGEDKDLLLEEYLVLRKNSALHRAKDELLAMFSENQKRSSYDVFFKDGNYDYFKDIRGFGKYEGSKYLSMFEKICEKDYQKVINSGIEAFNSLINFGYSNEQAIAVLTGVSIENWPKVVGRLLIEKRILQTGVIKDLKEISNLSKSDIVKLINSPESEWRKILLEILEGGKLK